MEAELVALEEEALRRIDVIPILETAGIDVGALRARPDADEIMRHVAGDELLVRSFERDFFETTIYPSGFPREQALAPVRSQAEGMLAGLTTPEARVESLTKALDTGATDPPEPVFYPPESGRVFQDGAGERGESDAP